MTGAPKVVIAKGRGSALRLSLKPLADVVGPHLELPSRTSSRLLNAPKIARAKAR